MLTRTCVGSYFSAEIHNAPGFQDGVDVVKDGGDERMKICTSMSNGMQPVKGIARRNLLTVVSAKKYNKPLENSDIMTRWNLRS